MMDEAVDIDMSFKEVTDVKEFTSKVVEKWRDNFEKGCLTSVHFEELWRVWVPKIYSPSLEAGLNTNLNNTIFLFNDDLGQDILINTLVEFICNGDPSTFFKQLSELDKAPSVCGKVFRFGEPTYSCRQCGMDKTCVLCVECFKNSEHRHHKYKMGTSCGGGCCDCGDVEAWKKAPFCKIHIAGVTEDEQKKSLPEDLKEKTRIIFEAVLWYAYRLLTTEQISDIRLGESSDNFFDIDSYCTILYNDEIHTFEQVIQTLARVLKCNHRSSTEFVTTIDREGRAVVKCSSFQHCSDLKQEIEKYTSRQGTKPLKVLVNHAYVVAHQTFAMKLLAWLEKFLGHGESFRKIFADVVLKPQPMGPCIIKGLLQRDTTLWKSARQQWHHLLIAGMLLEYENKKALAKIFTKNYGQVMKDFIKDDHDHAYSISSLSVQLFTVPTLAHHLIAHDDVLYILLNTLISECTRKCNKAGKLEFERSPSSQTFKRALYMLYDLRYLLSAIPEQWTDDLRRSFLHGLSLILSVLTMMQGMDAVTRQIGQHMEYEPEWESGFNLHIKLAYCISLTAEWCGSDKIVLVKAYRSVLKKLIESPRNEPNEAGEVRELADHSTACLHYDVSVKPVSIHLPLTRFLAALHLHLEKFNLHFDGPEFQVTKPTPVQIMEPVLRGQVMIAQVHAGMWRRNGYALLNTLFFYHNVKCRTEMLDRDITLLQIAASLVESNEFLIHVLNKFNLINWAMQDYELNSLKSPEEDSIRQTTNLVEELLHLLIVIVGERYMPGVSNITVEDRIRKEVIQYLCIKPLPHSELIKTIPDDDLTLRDEIADEVIQELAVFKKPTTGTGKGVYELKEQYFDDFNVFFYHYTREELSKADETQRKRRKAKGELECCPPPKLLKLNEPFSLLVNLLQCDVMLHIMQTVLERSLNPRARSCSESQLHKVLHLIGYALLEEESKNYPFFRFIENSSKFKILPLMEELLNSFRVDAHKALKWTINKYKQIADKKDESCSVVQKDVLMSEKVDAEKERRAKLAAERREKLMAQMQAMQKHFIKENASLFEETNTDKTSGTVSSVEVMDITEPSQQPRALGPNQTQRVGIEKTYTCILCQEEQKVTADGPTLVLAAFVQQASVLCQHKNNEQLMDITKHDPLYLHSNLGPAPHTSTCGHVMHSECWTKYFENIMVREHRRPYRLRHPASFDVDKQEFLCPLCECLSNTVLPLIPPLSNLQPTLPTNNLSFGDWLDGINIVLSQKLKVCHGIFKCNLTEQCENIHCNACINASNGTSIEPDSVDECEVNCILQPHQIFYSCQFPFGAERLPKEFLDLFPTNSPDLKANLKDMIQVFAQVAYTRGLNVNPHPSDKRLAPMSWKTLAYTVHSIEVLLRDANKPLLGHLSSRQRDCIESLIRIVATLGSTWTRSVVINSHAINLLSILFEHKNEGPSILQWDCFGFLVSLIFSLPSLSCKDIPTPVPTGGTLDWHTLRVIFICHIVKILAMMKAEDLDNSMDTDSKEDEYILEVLQVIGKCREGLSGSAIWKHVQYACLPFLRCCVLFFHYLTDVPAPVVLTESDGDTFGNMCTYLDLPQTPKELFDSPLVLSLVNKWCNHEEMVNFLNGAPILVVREPLSIPRLIDLPADYSELINTVSTFTCPNSDEDSRNPCMCLVCGEILCSQSYCCQTKMNKMPVGACNVHASRCGSGFGIFLRVRECEILLLAAPHRGCFMSPPYLDDYGETDQGLRRGNPLRLCPERYKKLQTFWLSHSIHEEIARSIETSIHIVTTQWNLL